MRTTKYVKLDMDEFIKFLGENPNDKIMELCKIYAADCELTVPSVLNGLKRTLGIFTVTRLASSQRLGWTHLLTEPWFSAYKKLYAPVLAPVQTRCRMILLSVIAHPGNRVWLNSGFETTCSDLNAVKAALESLEKDGYIVPKRRFRKYEITRAGLEFLNTFVGGHPAIQAMYKQPALEEAQRAVEAVPCVEAEPEEEATSESVVAVASSDDVDVDYECATIKNGIQYATQRPLSEYAARELIDRVDKLISAFRAVSAHLAQ